MSSNAKKRKTWCVMARKNAYEAVDLIKLIITNIRTENNELDTLFSKLFKKQLLEADKETLFGVLELSAHSSTILGRAGNAGINNVFKSVIECLICRSAFGALFDGVRSGQTDEELVDVLTVLCTALGIENYEVCRGALLLNMPVLSYIIKNEPSATPNAFCALLIQTAEDQKSCPLEDPRFEWSLDLPEPIPTNFLPRIDVSSMTIAIITDGHIDPLYEPYGVADCGEPVCCRKGQQLSGRSFPQNTYEYDDNDLKDCILEDNGEILIDMDEFNKVRKSKKLKYRARSSAAATPAGFWGDYRNCDTPPWAFENALDEIAEKHKDIDALYYIGDSIDHFVWETSYELIQDVNQQIVNKIKQRFGETPVVFAIGNHESQPTNQFAPSRVTGDKVNTTWLYDSLAEKWGVYIPRDALVSLRNRGDYSVLVRPGLRAISINNNVAYRHNWWLVYDPLESKRQLEWLVRELSSAELAGERVHILAHIPPGVQDLHYTYTCEYRRVVRRFASTIAAEFNGHTHTDEFKVFFDDDAAETPFAVAWNGGALTTYNDYNLNYKVVDVNTDDYRLSKMVTYIYNLTEANLTPERKPHWFPLYDMQHRYKLADLSPKSIGKLVYRMVTNDRELLDFYSAFTSKLSDTRWPYCGEGCKLTNLCKSVVTVLGDRRKCNKLRDLYFNNSITN